MRKKEPLSRTALIRRAQELLDRDKLLSGVTLIRPDENAVDGLEEIYLPRRTASTSKAGKRSPS